MVFKGSNQGDRNVVDEVRTDSNFLPIFQNEPKVSLFHVLSVQEFLSHFYFLIYSALSRSYENGRANVPEMCP